LEKANPKIPSNLDAKNESPFNDVASPIVKSVAHKPAKHTVS